MNVHAPVIVWVALLVPNLEYEVDEYAPTCNPWLKSPYEDEEVPCTSRVVVGVVVLMPTLLVLLDIIEFPKVTLVSLKFHPKLALATEKLASRVEESTKSSQLMRSFALNVPLPLIVRLDIEAVVISRVFVN